MKITIHRGNQIGGCITEIVSSRGTRIFVDLGHNLPKGDQEPQWKKMLKERGLSKARYFEHFKSGKYKLIGFGKDSETLEDVVIYQALYGVGQIWVRPYEIFFSKVTLPDGTEVERFKEIMI